MMTSRGALDDVVLNGAGALIGYPAAVAIVCSGVIHTGNADFPNEAAG